MTYKQLNTFDTNLHSPFTGRCEESRTAQNSHRVTNSHGLRKAPSLLRDSVSLSRLLHDSVQGSGIERISLEWAFFSVFRHSLTNQDNHSQNEVIHGQSIGSGTGYEVQMPVNKAQRPLPTREDM